jgi:CubicO group peptidase (beta-lactamase class C family)
MSGSPLRPEPPASPSTPAELTATERDDDGAIVRGHCELRFERVRDAFSEILTSGSEVGAALALYLDRRAVVDVWGGHTDAARTRPWDRDTIVNLFSVGKAVTAVCALRLVEAGLLDLDAPVARYWPEFAQAGKARIAVRHLLAHQAAVPAIARALPSGAWMSWDVMTEALAAQAPWWQPDGRHGYHVNTQGFLIGEVVRRVTGKTLGTYLRETVAGPAGIDFFIGVPPELDGRCADLLPPRANAESEELRRQLSVDPATLGGLDLMRLNAYRNPPEISGTGVVNTRSWRAAEVPSTNGHGNARAVARLYSALAGDGELDGVHVLSPATIARAIEEEVYGDDIVLQRPTRFGLGFQLTMVERPLGPGSRAFGHFGAGGSLGFADPDARVAFGYAMNQGRGGWQHKHVRHLIDLIYAAL